MDQMMNIMNNTGGGMLNVMGGGGGGGGGAGPGWNSAGPGGMNGSAGGPPADDQMASAEEFYQFLQQYQVRGESALQLPLTNGRTFANLSRFSALLTRVYYFL